MWKKTLAASVSICWRSFLLFQTVSCAKGSKQAGSKELICFRSSCHRGILIIKPSQLFRKASAFPLRKKSLTQSQEQNKTQTSPINSTSYTYWNENSTSDFGVKTQGTLHCSFARARTFRFCIGCDSGALKWSSSLSELPSNLQFHQLFIVTCGIRAMARLYILVN